VRSRNKVLVVVDVPPLRAELEKGLDRPELNVLFVSGGNLMQKVFDEVPHLILIDEEFAGGDGRALALSIKEDVVLKYIPIILLVRNGAAATGAPLRSEDEAFDLYFPKEGDIRHLLFCIRETIAQNHNELDLNPLTHLPGTRSTVLRIDRAAARKKGFSICCVDLSDLTAFNTAYGDARGDEIIVKLGHIVQEALKAEGGKDDFVGHLGGDDFVFVTENEPATRISEQVIRRFDQAIPSFYDANDRRQGYILQRNREGVLTQYPVMSVSVAIVHSHRGDARISEVGLIAGKLKKHMKAFPGSCYVRYQHHGGPASARNPEPEEGHLEVCFPTRMDRVRVPALSLRADKYTDFLNTILRAKKIRTLYQPILELKSRRIVGYEALTRALDESFVHEPSALFSMARESGRIKELDKLCVDFALKNGQALGDKKLFLNLNHETLIDPRAMQRLFSEKGAIGFKNIVIEVTEQSILRSFEKVKDALLELKEQGVSVAIDDVGGGAVSLRDVAVLKPDYIKFDRSLIRQIDTNITKQQIILSMLLFANGIQATTTAEGIETKEEYETVLMCGVPLGQGFFFAKPGKPFPELNL